MFYNRSKYIVLTMWILLSLLIVSAIVVFIFFPSLVFADSAGPNFPSSSVEDSSIGTATWTSVGNATASDNSRAGSSLGSSQITRYIKATNFGFSIPGGATIDGILVEWEVSIGMGSNPVTDHAVRIVKGGTIGSTDKSSGTAWTTSDVFLSHGGASDLWGETWTPADINATNFGAALSAIGSVTAPSMPQVDSVRITVTYTVASTISVSGTVYTNEGTTTMGAGKTVSVSVNGAAAAGNTTTASDGTYTISSITSVASDVLTVYLDGNTEKGATVTVGSGSNLTGIDIYQNDLITRCDNSCSLTNANLSTADNNGDADISSVYSVTGSDLTLASGNSLFIPSGRTFAPGGNINLPLNFTNNGTYTKGTETIALTDTSSTNKTFAGGNGSYYNLSITGGGAGSVTISGNNSFNNFTIGAPKTVTFTSSSTQTIAGTFSATGTASNIITINSSSAGTAGNLSKASGNVECDYLLLQDSAASGGAVWFAGAHSTGLTGNSGWVFAGAGGGGGSGGTPVFNQKHFQIFKDDKGLNSASSLAGEDVNYNVELGINVRLRFLVVNNGTGVGDITRRLEFKEDDGIWKRITSDLNNVRLVLSPHFADKEATTKILTSAGTFVAGQGKSTDSDTNKISLNSGEYVEDEYSLVFLNSAMGHSYQFRITDAGNVFDIYQAIPQISPESLELALYNINPVDGAVLKTKTPKITFSLNKIGDCRASLVNGSYDDMANATICFGQKSTFASCSMPNLGANGPKTIYFACQDNAGNKDTKENTHSVNYALSSNQNLFSFFTFKGIMNFIGGFIFK